MLSRHHVSSDLNRALMQGFYRHCYSGIQLNGAIKTTWMMAVVRKWRIFFAYLSAHSVKTNTVSMQNLTDVVSSFPHAHMHRCTQGVYVTAFGGSGKGTRNHLNQNTEREAHASDIWCSLPSYVSDHVSLSLSLFMVEKAAAVQTMDQSLHQIRKQ